MGMSTGGGKSGSVQSEINVTPLIDVLLVLLIIFLVLIPVMMKMQKLDVPRKITESESYDPNASMLTVKVMPDLSLVFNDGTNETAIPSADLGKMLLPKIMALTGDKVVFVDFADAVPWREVIGTMDSIRVIAASVGDIKVALKIREDQTAPQ
ncbi:MAG: biopolymer transporter ExbD [Kofleriaceae bacterium]